VGPCVFRVRDQPIDPPPLDLVGRPLPLISSGLSRAGKNARTHSDAQIAAIAASIKEWGWTTPALVGDNQLAIRSGHPCGSVRFSRTGSADRSTTARPCRPASRAGARTRRERGSVGDNGSSPRHLAAPQAKRQWREWGKSPHSSIAGVSAGQRRERPFDGSRAIDRGRPKARAGSLSVKGAATPAALPRNAEPSAIADLSLGRAGSRRSGCISPGPDREQRGRGPIGAGPERSRLRHVCDACKKTSRVLFRSSVVDPEGLSPGNGKRSTGSDIHAPFRYSF
jgi:hypothetical protein